MNTPEPPAVPPRPVLVARCENYREDLDTPCTGRIHFRWGQSQAACDTCGAHCGIAVAAWERVELAGAVPDTGQARADHLAAGIRKFADDCKLLLDSGGLDNRVVRSVAQQERNLRALLAEPSGDTVQASDGPPAGFWDESGSTSPVIDWSPVQAPDVARRLAIAQVVAEHWRDVAMQWGDDQIPGHAAAHPLACVLAAIAGETDELGVGPGPDADRIRALLGTDTAEPGPVYVKPDEELPHA